ncbi:MAG TPA: anti-sigma factor [Streptosporangiaceae bacterium]|nr:anti-sigma factor [Streptosporangiaceae bacterium]
MSADHELHALAAPFVMDAVTPGEREEFVRHLADCEQCRDDVREMQEATARLGMAATLKPRPELKDQTIRAAFLTSQLAPVAAEIRAEHQAEAQPPGTPRWRQLARRAWSIRLPARLALAAAALVIAAATSFGLLASSAMQQLHHSQRQDHVIAAVLNAPDAAMLTSKVSTGGTATVVMSHRQHCLVFAAHGLAPLPHGQAYELWLMGPGGDRPAGMLRPAAGGMAGPAVVFGLSPGDEIGLTIEPAEGSAEPTSVLIVVISPRS